MELDRERKNRVSNVNVRIGPDDLLDFQLASGWAGLSLNKWLLRAARQKFEMERLLREQDRRESGEEAEEEVLSDAC